MIYVASLAVGLAVGVVYGLINLRSPAPPVAALIGLLGMLAGENGVAAIRKSIAARTHHTLAASLTTPDDAALSTRMVPNRETQPAPERE